MLNRHSLPPLAPAVMCPSPYSPLNDKTHTHITAPYHRVLTRSRIHQATYPRNVRLPSKPHDANPVQQTLPFPFSRKSRYPRICSLFLIALLCSMVSRHFAGDGDLRSCADRKSPTPVSTSRTTDTYPFVRRPHGRDGFHSRNFHPMAPFLLDTSFWKTAPPVRA